MDTKRFAEMWCELNCWETPKEIRKKIKRDLARSEVPGAMAVCEAFTTKKEIDDAWKRRVSERDA